AEDERDVGDAGGIALAQVPDTVAEHRGSGGAVAVPVAEHRHIAWVAVLERVVSDTRSRRVPQIPDPLPNRGGPWFVGARHNRGQDLGRDSRHQGEREAGREQRYRADRAPARPSRHTSNVPTKAHSRAALRTDRKMPYVLAISAGSGWSSGKPSR